MGAMTRAGRDTRRIHVRASVRAALEFHPPAGGALSQRMKRLVALLVVLVTPLLAEEVTLKQPALLRSGRNAVSLKAGAVVELISRDGNEITIKYRELTGKIPASKLEEPKAAAPVAKAEPEKKAAKKAPGSKAPESKPANPPQTTYGKAVQKAKDNAAAHDKNLVRPADDVLKER
jgi:hypothetical protein